MGSVLEDGEWDKGLGVDVPFPEPKYKDQQEANDEKEDDPPVWEVRRCTKYGEISTHWTRHSRYRPTEERGGDK